jgi:hypothetical protein
MADPTLLTDTGAPDERLDFARNEVYQRNKAWARMGPYETKLNPNQEKQFRQWVDQKNIPFDPNESPNDYDMRGYWKALREGKVERRDPNDPEAHFPDTFKTPYHESFSRESRYATPDAPQWVPVGNEFHLIDKNRNIMFIDSRNNPPET